MIILLKIKDANKNAFVLIGWKWIYGFSELETESDIDNDCKWHVTFCPAQCHIFSKNNPWTMVMMKMVSIKPISVVTSQKMVLSDALAVHSWHFSPTVKDLKTSGSQGLKDSGSWGLIASRSQGLYWHCWGNLRQHQALIEANSKTLINHSLQRSGSKRW